MKFSHDKSIFFHSIVTMLMTFVFLLPNTYQIGDASTAIPNYNPFLRHYRPRGRNGSEYHLKGRLTNYYDPNDVFYNVPWFAQDSPLVTAASVSYDTEGNCDSRDRQGDSCPGHTDSNIDDDRVPRVIAEWKCMCQQCQLPSALTSFRQFRCKPIHQLYQILRRREDSEDWEMRWEPITVGCRCEEEVSPLTAVIH